MPLTASTLATVTMMTATLLAISLSYALERPVYPPECQVRWTTNNACIVIDPECVWARVEAGPGEETDPFLCPPTKWVTPPGSRDTCPVLRSCDAKNHTRKATKKPTPRPRTTPPTSTTTGSPPHSPPSTGGPPPRPDPDGQSVNSHEEEEDEEDTEVSISIPPGQLVVLIFISLVSFLRPHKRPLSRLLTRQVTCRAPPSSRYR